MGIRFHEDFCHNKHTDFSRFAIDHKRKHYYIINGTVEAQDFILNFHHEQYEVVAATRERLAKLNGYEQREWGYESRE